jgi:hypothetical protein
LAAYTTAFPGVARCYPPAVAASLRAHMKTQPPFCNSLQTMYIAMKHAFRMMI